MRVCILGVPIGIPKQFPKYLEDDGLGGTLVFFKLDFSKKKMMLLCIL